MNSDENSTTREHDSPRLNCYGCTHFFITWDKEFPYGCRKMEFRSKRLPSDDVMEADGQRCLAREESTRAQVKREQMSTPGDAKSTALKARKAKSRIGGSLNLKV